MEFKWLNEGEIVKKDNRIEIYKDLSIQKSTVKNIRAGK